MHPSVKFLIKFAISYLVGNIFYLVILKISSPDPFTKLSALLLDISSNSIHTKLSFKADSFLVFYQQKPVVNLAEGCNGMAIWISLMSFCIGYGGKIKHLLLLVPINYLILQLANLLRLLLLVEIKVNEPQHFHFFHEYAFPAILYGFAFILMITWVKFQQKYKPKNN